MAEKKLDALSWKYIISPIQLKALQAFALGWFKGKKQVTI